MSSMSPPPDRSRGRGYFWLGLFLCVLGIGLAAVQLAVLKLTVTPWYSPALATIGAIVLLLSSSVRPTIPRVFFFVLVAAFAGLQWHALTNLMKLPEYQGPVAAGKSIPAFTSTSADGKPFTEADLRDGSRRAMVFFRGRW